MERESGQPINKAGANENKDDEQAMLISQEMLASDVKDDLRIDFEKGMSYFPFLTIALISLNAIVFIWQISTGVLESQETIVNAGALDRSHVLNGEFWRLISPIFLHGSIDHLIGNCLVFYILGMACEHALGIKQAIIVYFFSGLCGSLLSVLMQPGPSVGASGAIFGVMGAVIMFLYKYQNSFFIRDKRIGTVLVIWALYTIIIGFLTPYIDNFAHIGGLVGGAVVTLFLKPRLLTKVNR